MCAEKIHFLIYVHIYKAISKINDSMNATYNALIAVVEDYFPTFNLILKFKL